MFLQRFFAPLLSLTSIHSLKLNLEKAFQPILHFFARMSAQPPGGQKISDSPTAPAS
jgi:hypothetical protein